MERFGASFDGRSLHVEGLPDAIKLIEPSGRKAIRLAHIAQHRSDLDYVKAALVELQYIN